MIRAGTSTLIDMALPVLSDSSMDDAELQAFTSAFAGK